MRVCKCKKNNESVKGKVRVGKGSINDNERVKGKV